MHLFLLYSSVKESRHRCLLYTLSSPVTILLQTPSMEHLQHPRTWKSPGRGGGTKEKRENKWTTVASHTHFQSFKCNIMQKDSWLLKLREGKIKSSEVKQKTKKKMNAIDTRPLYSKTTPTEHDRIWIDLGRAEVLELGREGRPSRKVTPTRCRGKRDAHCLLHWAYCD